VCNTNFPSLTFQMFIGPPLLFVANHSRNKTTTSGCGVCTTSVVEKAFFPSPNIPNNSRNCSLSFTTLKLRWKQWWMVWFLIPIWMPYLASIIMVGKIKGSSFGTLLWIFSLMARVFFFFFLLLQFKIGVHWKLKV
jgi:hypothetical protein